MAQLGMQIKMSPYSRVSMGLRQMEQQQAQQIEQLSTPEGKDYVKNNPQMQTQLENMTKQHKSLENVVKFFDYLEQADNKPELEIPTPARTTPVISDMEATDKVRVMNPADSKIPENPVAEKCTNYKAHQKLVNPQTNVNLT